ncbi:hypothetical protein IW262DRAFT_1469915 [Armillaria fumosa]|nr:hypothetical protein IW262DRAFT_1469915 [Armillaria fumosa]
MVSSFARGFDSNSIHILSSITEQTTYRHPESKAKTIRRWMNGGGDALGMSQFPSISPQASRLQGLIFDVKRCSSTGFCADTIYCRPAS